jgi:hypothetical protein
MNSQEAKSTLDLKKHQKEIGICTCVFTEFSELANYYNGYSDPTIHSYMVVPLA